MSYGDFEPEDVWCPTDDPVDLARNLGRRIALVDSLPVPRGTSVRAVLAAIAHRLDLATRRHRFDDRDRLRLRLEQIAVDLDTARARIGL